MYSFTYQLDDNDYLEFNKYHAFNAPVNRKSLIFMRYFYPLIIIILLLLVAWLTDMPPLLYGGIGAVFALIWSVSYKRIVNRRLKKYIAKIKKSGKLPFQKDVILSFGDEGIMEKNEISESTIKYSALERIVSDDNAVYLYHGAIQAYIIPLRVFESDMAKEGFLSFIRGKAGLDLDNK